jgi:hypothetical protein
MKALTVLLGALVATALMVSAGGGDNDALASHPASPQPLLLCSDVTADGPVTIADVVAVVARFGTNDAAYTANATYHPLYDLNPAGGTGSITVGDIVVAVSDFGLSCNLVSPVDTEIAQATLAVLGWADVPGGSNCPGTALLAMNQACLEEHGYYQSSFDVPGQGYHWVNGDYYEDDIYDPTKPEGLVYKANRLMAQLYFIDGNEVGWGPEPPGIENIDIDPFCTPTDPETQCSWSGAHDGWHLHQNLCTYGIGTPNAANTFTSNALQCEDVNNTSCGGPCGGTWRWNARVGWMGHMWNHSLNANPNPLDIAGNGRFTDCIPDMPWHWNGFNCPQ